MAKQIPVFAFAFAAFAATCAREPFEFRARAPDEQDADDLFLSLCRTPARASANFMVRLGLVVDEGGRAAGLCDRVTAATAEIEDLWLSQIVEGRHGLSGVVRTTHERRLGAGLRVSFELRHVLGWRLEADAPGVAPDAPTPVQILRAEGDGASAMKKSAAKHPPDGDFRAN